MRLKKLLPLKRLLPIISAASLVATLGGIASSPALANAYHHNHHQTQYRRAEARWEEIRRAREARRVQEAHSAERELSCALCNQ